ncbi:hypothetical protein BJV77DRAFT_1038545 [Russula vinacea]|nr:hypothetical protein BJV77DRAFT_1038545 [Russula vinacea]
MPSRCARVRMNSSLRVIKCICGLIVPTFENAAEPWADPSLLSCSEVSVGQSRKSFTCPRNRPSPPLPRVKRRVETKNTRSFQSSSPSRCQFLKSNTHPLPSAPSVLPGLVLEYILAVRLEAGKRRAEQGRRNVLTSYEWPLSTWLKPAALIFTSIPPCFVVSGMSLTTCALTRG